LSVGIAQLGLGAQHEHGQALERGRQQVAAAHQEDFLRSALEADEAGLHPALGRAKSRQPGLVGADQGEIIGQLALQEAGGIGALRADHAQVWKRCDAVQVEAHA
jgi:hypothetical protein